MIGIDQFQARQVHHHPPGTVGSGYVASVVSRSAQSDGIQPGMAVYSVPGGISHLPASPNQSPLGIAEAPNTAAFVSDYGNASLKAFAKYSTVGVVVRGEVWVSYVDPLIVAGGDVWADLQGNFVRSANSKAARRVTGWRFCSGGDKIHDRIFHD